MLERLRCRARLLAYSWFRTTYLAASHQDAWRFCCNHWHTFLRQALQEQDAAVTAPLEDAPVRLVC
jgi:hypothetical protein